MPLFAGAPPSASSVITISIISAFVKRFGVLRRAKKIARWIHRDRRQLYIFSASRCVIIDVTRGRTVPSLVTLLSISVVQRRWTHHIEPQPVCLHLYDARVSLSVPFSVPDVAGQALEAVLDVRGDIDR